MPVILDRAEILQRLDHAAGPGEPLSIAVWDRSPPAAERLAADAADLGFNLSPVACLADLCAASQMIVTTTRSTAPLVRSEWIAPGTRITAVGADSPGEQELETALVSRAGTLLADSAAQSIDHGELAHAVAAGLVQPARTGETGASLRTGSLTRESDAISIADLTGLGGKAGAIAGAILPLCGGNFDYDDLMAAITAARRT